jgi:hypothetical protein
MKMKAMILVLAVSLMLVSEVSALDAVVTEMEGTQETHMFQIDLLKQTVISTTKVTGNTTPPIYRYEARKDRHFWAGSDRFGSADDILAQIHTEDADLLIVRREHNSFGGPLRLLSALAGHPVQVSEIWLLMIKEQKESWSVKLVSKDSIYTWKASFHE